MIDYPELNEYDDTFASAPAEKEFDEVPDGKYQVFVKSVEMARTREKNLPMLKWQLAIIGPQCRGRSIFRNNIIGSKENVKWLKQDLAVCGMDVATMKLSELPERLHELLNVTLQVEKKTKGEFANVYFNKKIDVDIPKDLDVDEIHSGLPF